MRSNTPLCHSPATLQILINRNLCIRGSFNKRGAEGTYVHPEVPVVKVQNHVSKIILYIKVHVGGVSQHKKQACCYLFIGKF